MSLTLRHKFLIPTISLIILGMGLSSVMSYYKSKTALTQALENQINQLSGTTVTFLDTWIEDRRIELENWSKLALFKAAFKENAESETAIREATGYLVEIHKNLTNYEAICIADPSGNLIAATPAKIVGKINVLDRVFFKEGMKGHAYTSNMVKSRMSGNPVSMLSMPVMLDGQIKGVIFTVVDMTNFTRAFVDPIKVGETGYAFIMDKDGIILAHPDKSQIMASNLSNLDFVKDMLARKEGIITYTWQGEEKIVSFKRFEKLGWTVAVSGLTHEIFQSVYAMRTFNFLMALIITFAAGAIIFFIANSITKPIKEVVEGLKDAAEGDGDLTKRLKVSSRDEVGELSRWFNIFIEKIQSIISELSRNARQLTESSQTLTDVASQVSSGAEQVSDRASTVSSSSNDMTASMESVSKTMDETTSNINMMASATEEMESTISEIASNTEKARETTRQAVTQSESVSSKMNHLGNAAQEIEKVVVAITDISEQVNLLALNATIEAARAGEAGKGFAVVANEIKELARQTSSATDEIKARVEAIQSSTHSNIDEIKGITSVVDSVSEIVTTIAAAIEEQSVSTREISGNISQASIGVNDVNQSVASNSSTARTISERMSEMTLSIKSMADSSTQINTHASELSHMAETMSTIVNRFKV